MPSILPQPPHISVSDASGVSVRVDAVGRLLVELSARGLQVFVGPSAVQRSPLLTGIASSAKPWEVLSLPVGEDPLCAWLEMVNDRQLDCRCVASEEQLILALTAASALGDERAVQDVCRLLRPWLRRALGLRADRLPSTQHARRPSASPGAASAVRRKSLARRHSLLSASSPSSDLSAPSDMSSSFATPTLTLASPSLANTSASLASTGSLMSTSGNFTMTTPTGPSGMGGGRVGSVRGLQSPGFSGGVPSGGSRGWDGGAASSPEELAGGPGGADCRMSGDSAGVSEVSGSAMSETLNSLFTWDGETATADAAYEVLGTLPPDVAVALLRRALAPADPQPLHTGPLQIAVPPQFATLPPKLRPLAVRACAPCTEKHIAVSIKFPELSHTPAAPSSIAFASSAIPAVTGLTSLSLTFRRQARTSGGFDGKLASLLAAACSLPQLATLRISSLSLTAPRMHALARNLPRGRRLQTLCLSATPLSDDADSVEALAAAFAAAPRLERLEMHDTKLQPPHVTALSGALQQARSLAALSVTDSFLTCATAAALAAAVTANPTCREIEINRVTHIDGSRAPSELAVALGSANALCALTLRHFSSRRQALPFTRSLGEHLRGATALTRLDLGDSLGPGGAGPSGPIATLLGSISGLRHLNLRGAVITEPEDSSGLTWAIGMLTHLSHLDLSEMTAPAAILEQLSRALRMHACLQVLRVSVHMNEGQVSRRGATAFAACLASMHALNELELGHLPEEVSTLVAPVAAGMGGLSVLRLEHSEVGCGDAFALEELVRELRLKRSCVLRVLSLAGNDLGATCMIELARGLRNRPALRELDLSENPIGVRGARKLARVLSGQVSFAGAAGLGAGEGGCRPASLELLSLGECGMCRDGISALLPAVQCMQQLKELRVSGNPGVDIEDVRKAAPHVYVC